MHFHFSYDACDVEYGELRALRNQMSVINAKLDQLIKAMQVHILFSFPNVNQIAIGLSDGTAVDNVLFQNHAATSVPTSNSTFWPLSNLSCE